MKHLRLRRRGVLLYSGGIDSTLSAIILASQDVDLIGLSINYPGRPHGEVRAAKQIRKHLRFSAFIEVTLNTGEPLARIPDESHAPQGWIPYRNILFWAIGAHKAIMLEAQFVAAGHRHDDGTVFSDASAEFFERLNQILRFTGNAASERVIRAELPVFYATDQSLRHIARENWSLVQKTWSCWLDKAMHCRNCDACLDRQSFFASIEGSDADN